MTTLQATTPHFVRCVSPNSFKTTTKLRSWIRSTPNCDAVAWLKRCRILKLVILPALPMLTSWTLQPLLRSKTSEYWPFFCCSSQCLWNHVVFVCNGWNTDLKKSNHIIHIMNRVRTKSERFLWSVFVCVGMNTQRISAKVWPRCFSVLAARIPWKRAWPKPRTFERNGGENHSLMIRKRINELVQQYYNWYDPDVDQPSTRFCSYFELLGIGVSVSRALVRPIRRVYKERAVITSRLEWSCHRGSKRKESGKLVWFLTSTTLTYSFFACNVVV